jgi:GntR family transcriptional regulator
LIEEATRPVVQDPSQVSARQIAAEMNARIDAGELRPGDTLPTVRELMEQFGASTNTVQRALRELKDRGLISKAGRNNVVRHPVQLVERSADYTRPLGEGEPIPHKDKPRITEVGPTGAPDYVAELLDVAPGAVVLVRRRTMIRNEVEPVELVSSFYPMEIAGGTELAKRALVKGGSPTALARLGYVSGPSTEWVFGRLPTPGEAERLNLPAGAPVLRILRQIRTAEGRPLEVIEMVMSAERNVLRYEL